MSVFIVLQLRLGDMLSIVRMYTDRSKAFGYIENVRGEADSAWWKVLEIPYIAAVGREYEVVLNVDWETSNRVTCIGVYEKGCIPDDTLRRDDYNAETLTCE